MRPDLERLRIKTAIQYDPKSRGLRLALAYVRLPKIGTPTAHEIYGSLIGYSGGGCYDDEYFRVWQERGEFRTYSASYGVIWAIDRIGVSGFVGRPLSTRTAGILDRLETFLFRRWIKWTDNGLPDLQDPAKTRLQCWRKGVFWTTRGFDYNLLLFLSRASSVSLTLPKMLRQ